MKKLIILFISLFFPNIIFSQNIELVMNIPYGKPINHELNKEEGPDSGIYKILITQNNELLICDLENYRWLYWPALSENESFKTICEGSERYGGYYLDLQTHDAAIVGMIRQKKVYNFTIVENKKIAKYTLPVLSDKSIFHEFSTPLYFTDNILFLETSKRELVSVELLEDGKSKYRNESETSEWLTSGKGAELGYKTTDNFFGSIEKRNIFGDSAIDSPYSYLAEYQLKKDLTSKEKGYEKLEFMSQINYSSFGRDGKGLLYYVSNSHTNDSDKLNFAVLDSWTKEVYFYSVPEESLTSGSGRLERTVAPDGNLYFTGADDVNKQYYIKRICNVWWEEMGINKRIIGQMNTNHIPLMKTQTGTENDGYCFENDFVWIKEQSSDKKWSKIQKIDGRIGWIETKYIDINNMIPLSNGKIVYTQNVSVETRNGITIGRTMKTTDNLRLRKTELTSSEIITSMLKGTAVKILSFGREETIDGIKANWVEVEVQSGGKDRDGKSIPEGTRGWCFGGYLN